jgi:hypothetical protein
MWNGFLDLKGKVSAGIAYGSRDYTDAFAPGEASITSASALRPPIEPTQRPGTASEAIGFEPELLQHTHVQV